VQIRALPEQALVFGIGQVWIAQLVRRIERLAATHEHRRRTGRCLSVGDGRIRITQIVIGHFQPS
jgi:hypothetical protein